MDPLYTFLVGLVTGAMPLALLLRRRARPPAEVHGPELPASGGAGADPVAVEPAAEATEDKKPLARSMQGGAWPRLAADARAITSTVADQLSGMVTALEGNAHRLIESAVDPDQIPRSAERLWRTTRSLRQFQHKLQAYVSPPPRGADTTSVQDLLETLRRQLETLERGLQITFHVPKHLPAVHGDRIALQDALRFACLSLTQLEQGATRLTFSAEPHLDRTQPGVRLELHLDWIDDHDLDKRLPPNLNAFELESSAARNLVASQGGELTLLHRPGASARALVRLEGSELPSLALPAPTRTPTSADLSPREPQPERPAHHFGGVIVLATDTDLRAMTVEELKARGRNVFSCSDAAAVRTLLQATPERFELLVCDRESSTIAAEQLATSSIALAPELKVFILERPGAEGELPAELVGRVHRIGKPFGLRDLRAALEHILVG